MKIHSLLSLLCIVICFYSCGENSTQQADNKDTINNAASEPMNTMIRILDPEANSIIDSTAKIENLGGGFSWTEGPLYVADGDYLLFSDIPANKVMKWKKGEGITTYLYPAGFTDTASKGPENEPGSNGLLLDKDGKLVLCQHGDRRMARMLAPLNAPKAEFETIADKYNGKRFHSPNDAAYHSNGNLYVTDPPYGLEKGNEDPAKELDFHGVFRVTPDGKVDVVNKDLNYPNGIVVSNDGKFIIVGYSDGSNPIWMRYDLDEKGLSSKKSVFYKITEADKDKPGGPDGMKLNKNGYLFASGPGGIWIFNPSAKPIARIYTGQATSNCALSADEKTLFMTCDDFLYSVKLK